MTIDIDLMQMRQRTGNGTVAQKAEIALPT